MEKSRAVSVASNERSYHIFYQGLASDEIRSKYGLQTANPANYGFLKSSSDTYTIDGESDLEGFKLTMTCLKNIGFTVAEID